MVNEVQSRFTTYQQRTIAATESLAQSQAIIAGLKQGDDSSRAIIFEALSIRDRMNLSYEIYDRHRRLLSWSGIHSMVLDSAYFTPSVATTVLPGPILSYFIAVVPFKVDDSLYYVVGKRLFDVNYPISNRFVSNQAFATTFTSRFGYDIEFSFPPSALPKNIEGSFSVPLVSVGKDTLGYAYVQAPVLSEYQENAHDVFENIISVALILALLLALYLAVQLERGGRSLLVRAMLWSVGLWTLRYVMLWRDVPQNLLSSTLFDASHFASPFGFGLAKSVGDLFISALVLLTNIILIVSPWLARLRDKERTNFGGRNSFLVAMIFIGMCALMFICFRGFVATASSAVVDSSLPYDDPTFVLPTVDLTVMLASLMCIALSLVILGLAVGVTCFLAASALFFKGRENWNAWLVTLAIMAGLALTFGYVTANPLLSQLQRMAYTVAIVILSAVCYRIFRRDNRLMLPRSIVLLVVVAISFLIPALDQNVHKLDRVRTELLSADVLRPSDTWIRVVIQRALDELSNNEAVDVLSGNDSRAVSKLAFTQWAKSILSREGNNCAIVIFDQSGRIVSSFQIGISPFKASEPFVDIPPTHRYVDTEEQSGSNEKHFMGYTPIYSSDGGFLGGVWIELTSGRQTFLHDESANLLKNYSGQRLETRYRKLSISEYLHGRLLSTTDEAIPLGHRLPEHLSRESGSLQWVDETIDGISYETLYVRDQTRSPDDVWVALRLNSLDLRWHLFTYLRYVLFYIILMLVIGTLYLITYLLRGGELFANFRVKLMAAFMIVSVIPVIVLAYYNRLYVLERVEGSTEKRLSEQTTLVLSSVQRDFEVNAPFALSQVGNGQCTSLADRIDADFILYHDKYLQASSRPEIFTAELLDERLSAEAYVNIMLKKKSFYVQNRAIGNFPYVVGYRPITTESGAIIGVVSVPTLFRQSEIDEELTQRNVLLFGAYALALLLSIAVGTVFANQISSPILRLKDATKRLAEGDWNVRLRSGRKDELGELERSFDEMANDLQESQEQMLAVQREAAWKEMAKQVAHEIKNPLTPIKLSIQHLRRAYADNVRDFGNVLHQVSTTILQQIETLTRIASEFSNFARMPERKLSYCDVHEIITEAQNLFGQHTSITFRTDFGAQKSIVFADREELRRAFINIIRNAIQAMKEKGAITLRTTSDVDIIEIQMTDTGPGIPPEIKDRLFEPNFSTKTDGMGLGLSLVKKTVDDLGGTITIDSTPGSGTTVTMKLLLSLEHE